MTVVLSGVAADTTNTSPVPEVDADGGFDYVPIPERAREATTEETTYGDWRLLDGSTAAEHLDEIRPQGDRSRIVDGDEVEDWPLHHDPNFEAATYGERRPAYTTRLLELEAGDLVAFYTGLRGEDALHRYLIGYLEVDEVHDVDGMERERAAEVLRASPENAHSKRFEATDEVDDGLVVVEGRSGELFDRAFGISQRRSNGHYYLDEELQESWRPRNTASNAYLGGVKQAHLLEVDAAEFLDVIDRRSRNCRDAVRGR